MKNNTESKRIYLSNQLVAMLPPTALKVLAYFVGWSSAPEIKFNIEQLTSILHMTEEEIKLAVQTLYDHRLLRVENGLVEFNREQIQRYYDVPFSKVMESKGIQLSEEVTWNKESETKQKDIADMSEKEIRTLILRLQAQLHESEETKKFVVFPKDNETNDLPW